MIMALLLTLSPQAHADGAVLGPLPIVSSCHADLDGDGVLDEALLIAKGTTLMWSVTLKQHLFLLPVGDMPITVDRAFLTCAPGKVGLAGLLGDPKELLNAYINQTFDPSVTTVAVITWNGKTFDMDAGGQHHTNYPMIPKAHECYADLNRDHHDERVVVFGDGQNSATVMITNQTTEYLVKWNLQADISAYELACGYGAFSRVAGDATDGTWTWNGNEYVYESM